MEIVVRTPHGDADVSIAVHAATTTLGEVIAAVTGQAIPRLVSVDNRLIDAGTRLDEVGLCIGSVVATEPSGSPVASSEDVRIIQVAGSGAGRATRVGPGRYRIGPGRRSNADELDLAPVERTAFELVIETTDAASMVTVLGADDEVALDGVPVGVERRWQTEVLTVGPRAFRLERPAGPDPVRAYSPPDRDGTVAFSRPPRRRSVSERQPVVDAARDAKCQAPTLWERRPDHSDAYELPIGVQGNDAAAVNAALTSDRALAITGSEPFRQALARTIIVEATTLHGPADLELVIVTDPERLPAWDWAKWLPHVRLDGSTRIWSSNHDVIRWVERAGEGSPMPAPGAFRVTMLVVDDPGRWSRRDGALRSLLSAPPEGLRPIALCREPVEAPAVCTTVISETGGGLARLQRLDQAGDELIFRPALTEMSTATDVARSLAPLVDIELAPSSTNDDVEPVELDELVGSSEADSILARWASSAPRSTAALGRDGHEPVEVPVADDVTIVIGPSMADAFDIAATSLLAQCLERSPDDLWVVPLAFDQSPRSEFLWRLPHATDPHDRNTTIEPHRLLARLRAVLTGPDAPSRVVLVVEAPAVSVAAPDEAWLIELGEGVRATDGLALIVIADHADGSNLAGDTVIRVQRRAGATGGGAVRRSATIDNPDGSPGRPFVPVQRSLPPADSLDVFPFVTGRRFTPLERRLEQRRALRANAPDVAFEALVAPLREAASRNRPPRDDDARVERIVVPPPMPTTVDLEELFAVSPGDGVPLGFADDPTAAGLRTWWWEPGSGSLLVFGSRRSGMEQALTTVLVGLVDRFSDLDVHLVVVEHSSERRRMLESVDREMRVIAPEHADQVAETIDVIAAELERNQSPPEPDREHRPRLVVLIDDLARLRQRYADNVVGARIDEVLAAAADPLSGVDVIASVVDLEAAGPYASATVNRLVGASSNHGQLSELGVRHPNELDGVVGRCRAFPGGDLVQVAIADAPLHTLLAQRSIGEGP
jgi:S-DNA-T family DNA segregation ATPase FtsK/SpoIIIE